jgi:hypothetical protein
MGRDMRDRGTDGEETKNIVEILMKKRENGD